MYWLEDHFGWVILAVTIALIGSLLWSNVHTEAAYYTACDKLGGSAVYNGRQWECWGKGQKQ